jgi:hypothetical protein
MQYELEVAGKAELLEELAREAGIQPTSHGSLMSR